MSKTFSNICPAPKNCEPALKIPKYLVSSLSPNAGTVIDKSTNATDGRLPGIFKP